MKQRYTKNPILASQGLYSTFPTRGSASGSDARNGRIKFGSGKLIQLGDGLYLNPTTGLVTVDAKTGDVAVYLNLYLGSKTRDVSYEWTGYTLEEAQTLIKTLLKTPTSKLLDNFECKYQLEVKHSGRDEWSWYRSVCDTNLDAYKELVDDIRDGNSTRLTDARIIDKATNKVIY